MSCAKENKPLSDWVITCTCILKTLSFSVKAKGNCAFKFERFFFFSFFALIS